MYFAYFVRKFSAVLFHSHFRILFLLFLMFFVLILSFFPTIEGFTICGFCCCCHCLHVLLSVGIRSVGSSVRFWSSVGVIIIHRSHSMDDFDVEDVHEEIVYDFSPLFDAILIRN